MQAAELTHHLEREAGQNESGNHRNGTSAKTVTTPDGALKLKGSSQPICADWHPGNDVTLTPERASLLAFEFCELLQYTLTTRTVAHELLLIAPSRIMKYHILDFQPHDSLLRYLVESGYTGFIRAQAMNNIDLSDPDTGAAASTDQSEATAGPARQSTGVLPRLIAAESGGESMLRALARLAGPLRIGVVHPCDAPSLAAVCAASVQAGAGFIDPLIVAPRIKLEAVAKEAHIDLTPFEIDDVPHSHAAAARAVELAAQRRVDALMKGSLHTDELMAAVVAPGSGLHTGKRISHCFLVDTSAYERPLLITDAAVNVEPDLAQKCAIVQNAIDLAHALGVAIPRVAILCAVEMVNPRMRSTIDAAALSKMAERGQLSGALVDGPLAFDNAVSIDAARLKGIESRVAGRPDILVVPDLEAGNMLAKLFEFLGDAASAGIVLGASVPIVLTSRADSVAGRIDSCALAAIVAARMTDHGSQEQRRD